MEPSAAQPIEVLVNPRAGGEGAGLAASLRERLGAGSRVRVVAAARLAEETAAVAAAGAPVLAVAGGDGSLVTAARVLAGTRTALAPLPTGTLNHFARRLGLTSLDDALRALAAGDTRAVPIGIVDDAVFLNTATFGLYADVVRRRERWRRWVSKWPAAAAAIILEMLRLRRLEMVLEVEGERIHRRTPLLWVGVGRGTFPRVLDAPDEDGRVDLEIVLLVPRGRFGIAGLLVRIVRLVRSHRPAADQALEIYHARSLLIRAPARVGVTLDGEVMRMEAPIFLSIQEDGLTVVAPSR